jgi:hypothetical protein
MSLGLHSQTVNVSRKKLLDALEENLKKHCLAYEKAVLDYRKALQVDLTEALVKANDPKSNLADIKVEFKHPVSYAAQYVQVIDMLKFSVDETIQLESEAFRAYVKDEWSWKSGFELTNRLYASKAAGVPLGGSL